MNVAARLMCPIRWRAKYRLLWIRRTAGDYGQRMLFASPRKMRWLQAGMHTLISCGDQLYQHKLLC